MSSAIYTLFMFTIPYNISTTQFRIIFLILISLALFTLILTAFNICRLIIDITKQKLSVNKQSI